MKKKISTLLVAALTLFGSVSAFAQLTEPTLVDQNRHGTNAGYRINSLTLNQNVGLFQLALETNPNHVLIINDDLKLEVVDITSGIPANANYSFANTLWCVTVQSESQSQPPKYDFLNKGAGANLSIAVKGTDLEGLASNVLSVAPHEVGGEVYGWSLYAQYLTATGSGRMYSTFKTDSVIGLVANAPGDVQFVKKGFALAEDDGTAGTIPYTQFELRAAASIRLDANDINTILGDQDKNEGVQLTFSPDVMGSSIENPFNAQKFFAEDISGSAKLVHILRADSSYLKVDTAYTNDTGIPFLAYKWDNLKKANRGAHGTAADSIAANQLARQYAFSFVYSPTYDSLYIQVQSAYVKPTSAPNWATAITDPLNNRTWPYVSIQDIEREKYHIFTFNNTQNTHISFGYEGCKPMESNYTSLEGVYLIRNKAGKYLASPLHYNGDSIGWVTIEDQEPQHMPAYQWVVLKTRTVETLAPTSPVNIYNREYAWDGTANVPEFAAVQLNQNAAGEPYYVTTLSGLLYGESLEFIEVEQANRLDEKLGYRYIGLDSLYVSKYQFNYFNPFTDVEYLGKGDGNDSILYAKSVKDAFTLINAAERNFDYDPRYKYGFQADTSIQRRVGGLVQSLERTPYHISLRGVGDYRQATEDRYAIGSVGIDTVYVFFKENNHYNGKHYYSFVEADRNVAGRITGLLGDVKAVVTDDTKSAQLKIQDITGARTSSFTVEPDDSPLYRRFNSADENVDKDTTVILEFYEKYRKEVLQIEGNKEVHTAQNKIDFLGIWTEAKAPSGTSFIVDTAWVNRGLGNVKPQYLISIERNDFAGQAADSCPLPHEHINGITPWTCPHATPAIPAFNRGKYLVNFAGFYGSAGKSNSALPAPTSTYWAYDTEYMWADYYDKAGFLHAIHLPDSDLLIVINPQAYPYFDVENENVNYNALKADTRNRVVDLRGDHHKYVTWSMRYVDPENALGADGNKEFLMESMKEVNDADIAPDQAQWLKSQNGVLVLSEEKTSLFENMKTGGDDALIFDVNVGKASDIATDNEQAPSVAGVVVVAGNGEVTIKNANGKKVAISNVLGQTVANTVLTSDNATIAAPQGVVVVAVEGEKAVKAVVK